MHVSPLAVSAFEAALPADARVVRKQMFGLPAAFVNRQMFFGTFGDDVIARVGPDRAAALIAEGAARSFSPREGQTWGDYIVLASDDAGLSGFAAEAMTYASRLPQRAPSPVKKDKKKKKKSDD